MWFYFFTFIRSVEVYSEKQLATKALITLLLLVLCCPRSSYTLLDIDGDRIWIYYYNYTFNYWIPIFSALVVAKQPLLYLLAKNYFCIAIIYWRRIEF